jgi:hypothetical protein
MSKIMTNKYRNRNSTQPMRWCNMHSRGSGFFFWGRGNFALFFLCVCVCFQCVPIKFSKGSSNLQCVHQDVPNSTTLLSYMLCLKLSCFHLSRWAEGEALHLWNNRLYCFFFFFFHFSIFGVFFKHKDEINIIKYRYVKKEDYILFLKKWIFVLLL